MVHVPAKFRENISMRLRVTVRKLHVTDGRGALQYLPSRAFGAAGDNNVIMNQAFIIINDKIMNQPQQWCTPAYNQIQII